MNYRDLSKALLLLTLASTMATIFASLIPGAWWQWLLATIVLLFAAAGCSGAADREAGE